MSDGKIDSIMDAAYECFRRHGVRRTTMEDIARQAGMSRPAVYLHVGSKEEAFHRLAERMLAQGLADFRAALTADGGPGDRLANALTTKLELTLRVWRESPHAEELLGDSAHLSADLLQAYGRALREELTASVHAAFPGTDAAEFSELLLALVHGLEVHSPDPTLPLRRLRQGVALLVTGLVHESLKESP